MGKKILLVLLLLATMGAGALSRRPDLIDAFRDKYFHDSRKLSDVLRRKVEASIVSISLDVPKTDVRFSEPFRNTPTTGLTATRPLGSAFHLGDNRFVTNAHVFQLRDIPFADPVFKATSRSGTVMPIKKILAFDEKRDIAVFEVDPKYTAQIPGLEVEPQPQVGMPVWATASGVGLPQFPVEVGELGDTVAFGGFDTPKISGGPLVNSRGRVVGILNGKTDNGQQGRAIPVSVLDQVSYSKTNFANKQVTIDAAESAASEQFSLDIDVVLPQAPEKIHADATEKTAAFVSQFERDFVAKHSKELFPRDAASRELLRAAPSSVFGFFTQAKRGGPRILDTPKYSEIEKDGRRFVVGHLRSTEDTVTFLTYLKPQELQQWLGSPIQVADLLSRIHDVQVGYGKNVKPVQSWGQPVFAEKFSDRLGRVWATHHWITPDGTQIYVTNCTLLVSQFACISGLRSAEKYFAERARFRTVAHLYALTYSGTGTDWFIVQKNFADWLPPSLRTGVDFNDRTDEFKAASAEVEVETVFEREILPTAIFTVAMGVPPSVESGYYPLRIQVTPDARKPTETYTFQFYAHEELAREMPKPETVTYSSIGLMRFAPPGSKSAVTEENLGNTGVALSLRPGVAKGRAPASITLSSPVNLICAYGTEEPKAVHAKDCAKVGARVKVRAKARP